MTATGQVLELVRTRAATSKNAVQRMTSLAKNRSEDHRKIIYTCLWSLSFEAARKSTESITAIADFLCLLSLQAQEDYDDQPRDDEAGKIMVIDDWWNKEEEERLWHDMPGMWDQLDQLRLDYFPPAGVFSPDDPDREVGIDLLCKDRRFISTLSLASSRVFSELADEVFKAFHLATQRPSLYPNQKEEWQMWIPAVLFHLNTAGAEMKEYVLRSGPYQMWPNLGCWLQWQRKFLATMTEDDETLDIELRATVKQIHDMMTIEKHLTNHWWYFWQHDLSKLLSRTGGSHGHRDAARTAIEVLAIEDAEMKRTSKLSVGTRYLSGAGKFAAPIDENVAPDVNSKTRRSAKGG